MVTVGQIADLQHRVRRLEDKLDTLTALCESLAVSAAWRNATAQPVKPHRRGVEPAGFAYDEANELSPDEAPRGEVEPLTSADLDALPKDATVYDAYGAPWTKEDGNLWWFDDGSWSASAFWNTSTDLIRTFGPIAAGREQPPDRDGAPLGEVESRGPLTARATN